MRNRLTVAAALALCAAAAFAGAGVSSEPQALLSPSIHFVLQLGVLVLAAKAGGALFERWRMPVVLGELMAGVLVGPHLLGGLSLPLFPKGVMSDVGALLTPLGPVYSVVTVTLVVLFFSSGSIRTCGRSGAILPGRGGGHRQLRALVRGGAVAAGVRGASAYRMPG